MQIIAGLSKTLYWITNYLFDFIFLIIVFGFGCIGLYCFDKYEILSPDIGLIFMSFVFAMATCLLVTYFIVNLNIKKQTTDTLIKYSLLITGIAAGIYDIIYLALKLQDYSLEKSLPTGSFMLKVLSPVYNTVDIMFEIIIRYMIRTCQKNLTRSDRCVYIRLRDYDLKYNILAYLISMSIFALLIFLVNYYDHKAKKIIERAKGIFKSGIEIERALEQTTPLRGEVDVNFLSGIEDPNIEKEKELTQMLIETNNSQSNILVVHDLYKMFGSLQAVDHLSFTVKREECFGLLGVNGAGKTTTFKMIGGAHHSTSGKIVLDNYTFEKNPYEYYRRLGYCTQENTHTKRITVTDHLIFYAKINGIPSRLIDKTVKTLIEECDLQDHKFKFAEKLSGGNKRKLSTAIALIGKKDLILLGKFNLCSFKFSDLKFTF